MIDLSVYFEQKNKIKSCFRVIVKTPTELCKKSKCFCVGLRSNYNSKIGDVNTMAYETISKRESCTRAYLSQFMVCWFRKIDGIFGPLRLNST